MDSGLCQDYCYYFLPPSSLLLPSLGQMPEIVTTPAKALKLAFFLFFFSPSGLTQKQTNRNQPPEQVTFVIKARVRAGE